MALNAHQLISRVLPGRPFGDGRDGNLTVSSSQTQSQTRRTCSGTSGTKTLTINSSGFSNGDIVLIIQMRGTSVGSWEINKVASGGGSTTLTMQENLQTTYNHSGSNCAQVIKIPMYSNVTVNGSVNWSAPNWDGNDDGILLFACNGTFTNNGTVRANGGNGSVGDGTSVAGGSGAGFRGGTGDHANPSQAQAGENSSSAPVEATAAVANGGGGSGGSGASTGGGGGGGGNGTAGSNGAGGSSRTGGTGGSTAGSAELTTMILGGGAGGGCNDGSESAGTAVGGGGSGAGIIFIIAKIISNSGGSITANGGYGGNASPAGEGGDGGGGAGGSILLQTQTATIGTSQTVATGGSGYEKGGAGGNGRIAIHYSGNIGGTSNPTYNQTFDGRLIEQLGGLQFFM